MADLNFSQPERSSFLVPGLIAVAVLAIVFALVFTLNPRNIADITVTHSAIVPTHTVFASGSMVVGRQDQSQDDLYVVVNVRIKDDLKLPLFIKGLSGTLSTADGDETSSAIQKKDLDNLYVTFPALKPLASAPLLPETQIQPGQTAEGMVLLHFSQPQTAWDQRKAAAVTIDFYHQGPLSATIPK